MSTVKSKKYHWTPDLPDHRDRYYTLVPAPQCPLGIELEPWCPPVGDQGQLGSCLSNALAENVEFLGRKGLEPGRPPDFMASRLFIYWNTRNLEGTINQDAGGRIRDGIKSLYQYGACNETEWPYDICKFEDTPTQQAFTDGAKNKISQYSRIADGDLAGMLNCLESGFPFVFGFSVPDYFESEQMAQTGIMRDPTDRDRIIGGHAVMAIGFKDRMFKIRNSYGPGWGDHGNFWMSFDFLSNPNLVTDLWTIRK